MTKERIPCAKCAKYFWALLEKDGQPVHVFCQKCRNKMEHTVHKETKRKMYGPSIRIVEKNVDLRMEVERLRRLEIRYPDVVKKIREGKKDGRRNKKKVKA